MPEVIFSVDPSRSMREQAVPGHNRWHPDIPPVASIKPGSEVRIECREWTDGQIGNNDSANDVRDVDLSVAHMLSGPFAVEGAEPGDLLVLDILDLGPIPQQTGDVAGQGWGYTGIFDRNNSGGFLTDYYPDAAKAIWDFHGQEATSRHLPGVRYTGITHPGLFGVAPSAELLGRWNRREAALIATAPDRVPPLALPPLSAGALLGSLAGADYERVAEQGARTVPARENGGNHDIKNFTRGSRVFFPVHVAGALFSGGDLHFSQGDGEITFCGAIEMGGFIDFHVDLIKGGMQAYGVTTNPIFMPGRVEPRYSEFLTFIGISVDHDRHQLLPGRDAGLQTCLPQRRGVPEEVRLLRRAGVPAARLRPHRGADQRGGRHPQRVLLVVSAHPDLRLRHHPLRRRAHRRRPRCMCPDHLRSPRRETASGGEQGVDPAGVPLREQVQQRIGRARQGRERGHDLRHHLVAERGQPQRAGRHLTGVQGQQALHRGGRAGHRQVHRHLCRIVRAEPGCPGHHPQRDGVVRSRTQCTPWLVWPGGAGQSQQAAALRARGGTVRRRRGARVGFRVEPGKFCACARCGRQPGRDQTGGAGAPAEEIGERRDVNDQSMVHRILGSPGVHVAAGGHSRVG